MSVAGGKSALRDAAMNTSRSIVAGAALLTLPAEAQVHRLETDPVVTVRENFVACDVLSQLQRVMDDPRFLLTGECEPLSAGRRVRIYAIRGPYVCIYPQDTIMPCKWTHQKVLSNARVAAILMARSSDAIRGRLRRFGPKKLGSPF